MAGYNPMAAIAASLHPGEWTKDPSPEESLKTFNLYIEQFERWIDVCGIVLNLRQQWNLLIATGKTDMEDLVRHQAKVEIRQVQFVQAVQAREAVIGVPAGVNGQPPAVEAQPAVEEVIGVAAVEPTPWKTGIEWCRRAITPS